MFSLPFVKSRDFFENFLLKKNIDLQVPLEILTGFLGNNSSIHKCREFSLSESYDRFGNFYVQL